LVHEVFIPYYITEIFCENWKIECDPCAKYFGALNVTVDWL